MFVAIINSLIVDDKQFACNYKQLEDVEPCGKGTTGLANEQTSQWESGETAWKNSQNYHQDRCNECKEIIYKSVYKYRQQN